MGKGPHHLAEPLNMEAAKCDGSYIDGQRATLRLASEVAVGNFSLNPSRST